MLHKRFVYKSCASTSQSQAAMQAGIKHTGSVTLPNLNSVVRGRLQYSSNVLFKIHRNHCCQTALTPVELATAHTHRHTYRFGQSAQAFGEKATSTDLRSRCWATDLIVRMMMMELFLQCLNNINPFMHRGRYSGRLFKKPFSWLCMAWDLIAQLHINHQWNQPILYTAIK